MMRFDVITLFPEVLQPYTKVGVTRRAFLGDTVGEAVREPEATMAVHYWPLRDFATDAYHRVDDRPYGGGPGMVLLAEPVLRALAAAKRARQAEGFSSPVIYFTPSGRQLDQCLV